MGHEAYVLAGGVDSGLALPAPEAGSERALPSITAQALADALKDDAVALIDLRPSMVYRKSHIPGARWSIRPLLASAVEGEQRPLAPRLEVHERQALAIAQWLQAQAQVKRVFHPALPDHPGHALWRRDFNGSNGLLSFELHENDTSYVERFIDALQLFGLGASWGGYESLVTVADLHDRDSAADRGLNPVLRLHVGLEDVEALIEDLQRGFAALG